MEPATPRDPALWVSVDEQFYDVDGDTPGMLNRDLARNGPRRDGRAFQGLTDFQVRYRFDPRPVGGGCRATDARVHVEVVTTLPLWIERDTAPESLRRDWDVFRARLREHERGHQDIAIAGGKMLLDEVERLAAPDCAALRADAERVAQALQRRLDLEQRDWDAETGHGRRGTT